MTKPAGLAPSDPAFNGQRHYTRPFLRIYDFLVLRFFGPVIWRCPSGILTRLYDEHVGRRHLDVGPGTGYFLQRARFPADAEVTLLDPNREVLDYASRRLRDLQPRTVQADVCKPLPVEGRYDSAALSYVLHCLPSGHKATAIRNVAQVLQPEGVLFGASVLGTSGPHTWVSRRALLANNRRTIFDNLDDSEDGLTTALRASFKSVDVSLVGSVAVFTAREPVTQ